YLDDLKIGNVPLTITGAAENLTFLSEGLNIFPNPTGSDAEISYNALGGKKIGLEISDILGHNVGSYSEDLPLNGQFRISLKALGLDLAPGIYMVRSSVNGKVSGKKLVVKP
ncbi:MAG: T9SS type A sorting domain-containing protein, partial [Bacteroidota bacterium]